MNGTQPGLFDQAVQRRDIGIDQSAEHAGEEWKREALVLARRYCETHDLVFVDDLWDWGLESGESDRALGNVIQTAARAGWIEKIPMRGVHPDAFASRPSVRSNLSPKPVWKSRISRVPVGAERHLPATGSSSELGHLKKEERSL
jgi:hypothetical protein